MIKFIAVIVLLTACAGDPFNATSATGGNATAAIEVGTDADVNDTTGGSGTVGTDGGIGGKSQQTTSAGSAGLATDGDSSTCGGSATGGDQTTGGASTMGTETGGTPIACHVVCDAKGSCREVC
jgi:hypothetical protein